MHNIDLFLHPHQGYGIHTTVSLPAIPHVGEIIIFADHGYLVKSTCYNLDKDPYTIELAACQIT